MKEYANLNDYELIYMISENIEDARDIMYKKYFPLIRKMAFKYYKTGKNYGLGLEDFIQEGYIGLFEALTKYTDDRNCLFYTFLYITISSKMNNLLRINCSGKAKLLNQSLSLYDTFDSDNEGSLIDIIEDKNALLPDTEIMKDEFFNKLKDSLYTLPMKYSCILELKMNGFTNKSISKLLDINIRTVSNSMNIIRKRINSLKNYL